MLLRIIAPRGRQRSSSAGRRPTSTWHGGWWKTYWRRRRRRSRSGTREIGKCMGCTEDRRRSSISRDGRCIRRRHSSIISSSTVTMAIAMVQDMGMDMQVLVVEVVVACPHRLRRRLLRGPVQWACHPHHRHPHRRLKRRFLHHHLRHRHRSSSRSRPPCRRRRHRSSD